MAFSSLRRSFCAVRRQASQQYTLRLFRLMKGASKWEELIFLLESLDDPDLFTAADAGIRRWLDRVNRSAVPITPAQAGRLRALLKTAPLDGPTRRALAFLLPG